MIWANTGIPELVVVARVVNNLNGHRRRTKSHVDGQLKFLSLPLWNSEQDKIVEQEEITLDLASGLIVPQYNRTLPET